MPKIVIAVGPVIVEDNKVLLNQHGEDSFWKFCGGRLEESEGSLRETAIREVKEEMGLDIEILDNQPRFFYAEKESDGAVASVLLVHFLAKRLNEVVPGPDIRRWRWINLSELDKENLAPNIKPILRDFGFIE